MAWQVLRFCLSVFIRGQTTSQAGKIWSEPGSGFNGLVSLLALIWFSGKWAEVSSSLVATLRLILATYVMQTTFVYKLRKLQSKPPDLRFKRGAVGVGVM